MQTTANTDNTSNAPGQEGMAQGRSKLHTKVQELMQDRNGLLPVWVRAPVHGPEYFTGITRPKLYQLHAAGLIKSVSIREPGQIKGVRLFHLGSVLDFIETRAASQNANTGSQ